MLNTGKDYRHGKASKRRTVIKESTRRTILVDKVAAREAAREMRGSR